MSTQMVIELSGQQATQTVLRAIDLYKTRLRASIARTQRHLAEFEQRYRVTTAHFLTAVTAEDLAGGDLEYVEWAGEAKLLKGLEIELGELEHVCCQCGGQP
jgi:hypothetical protein